MATVEAAGAKVKPQDNLVIRSCDDTREFEECVQIQRDVWGFSDEDLVPMRLFVVATKIGGQVIGAFAAAR